MDASIRAIVLMLIALAVYGLWKLVVLTIRSLTARNLGRVTGLVERRARAAAHEFKAGRSTDS